MAYKTKIEDFFSRIGEEIKMKRANNEYHLLANILRLAYAALSRYDRLLPPKDRLSLERHGGFVPIDVTVVANHMFVSYYNFLLVLLVNLFFFEGEEGDF
jgi:hypothetical protein